MLSPSPVWPQVGDGPGLRPWLDRRDKGETLQAEAQMRALLLVSLCIRPLVSWSLQTLVCQTGRITLTRGIAVRRVQHVGNTRQG